jgi:REP element-mobilizing transposase RayT
MPFWQLFYHVVWTTKNREPVIDNEVEPIIYEYLRTKAIGLGAKVFALDGWFDHVHMIAAVPPKIALSEFIGKIKGVATAKFNQSGHPKAPIYWQTEYAIFSFDKKRLPNYVQYVERQKQHHQEDTIIPILERTQGKGIKIIREPSLAYGALDDAAWRREFEE